MKESVFANRRPNMKEYQQFHHLIKWANSKQQSLASLHADKFASWRLSSSCNFQWPIKLLPWPTSCVMTHSLSITDLEECFPSKWREQIAWHLNEGITVKSCRQLMHFEMVGSQTWANTNVMHCFTLVHSKNRSLRSRHCSQFYAKIINLLAVDCQKVL